MHMYSLHAPSYHVSWAVIYPPIVAFSLFCTGTSTANDFICYRLMEMSSAQLNVHNEEEFSPIMRRIFHPPLVQSNLLPLLTDQNNTLLLRNDSNATQHVRIWMRKEEKAMIGTQSSSSCNLCSQYSSVSSPLHFFPKPRYSVPELHLLSCCISSCK